MLRGGHERPTQPPRSAHFYPASARLQQSPLGHFASECLQSNLDRRRFDKHSTAASALDLFPSMQSRAVVGEGTDVSRTNPP
jgi:hypothetical protein